MYLLKRLAVPVFVCAVAAHAQSARSQSRVTEEDVIQCLLQSGYTVKAEQVNLLSTIPVTTEHPDLELLKVETAPGEKYRALLRCVDRSACIPFYAIVSGVVLDTKTSAVASVKGRPKSAATDPVLVKRGSTAILEIASREMLITLPVICLQNGRAGERIRVMSQDRKMTYVAEVVRKGFLRSSL